MTIQIPNELFEGAMVFVLSAIWKSYRAMWKHIIEVEKRILMIMVMLRDRGFEVPDESDTEIFRRANKL